MGSIVCNCLIGHFAELVDPSPGLDSLWLFIRHPSMRKKSRSRLVRVHVLHARNALNDTSSLSTQPYLSTQPRPRRAYPRSLVSIHAASRTHAAAPTNVVLRTSTHGTTPPHYPRNATYPRSGTHQRSAPYCNVWLTIHATLRGHVVTLRGIATPSVSRDISLLTYLPVYRQ